jgi:putative chitinase
MIHRKYFFDSVRGALFGGALTQQQVDGLNVFLAYADEEGLDDRCLAYILATTFHETDATMQPIAEYGKGAGKPYGTPDPETGETYYGRGYVQLTWRENYQKQDDKLGLAGTLVSDADRALEADLAVLIICEGMRDGDFTGKKLADWIDAEQTDFHNARTIVNGLDRASDIAGYAAEFAAAITHTADELATAI